MRTLHPAGSDAASEYYRAVCDSIARYVSDGGNFRLESSVESGVQRITFSLDHEQSGRYFARLGAPADDELRGTHTNDAQRGEFEGSRETFDAPSGPVDLRRDPDGTSLWATTGEIACLFDCSRDEAASAIRSLFARGLDEATTSRKVSRLRIVQGHEVARIVTVYNLDLMLAVGSRVNPLQADALRCWAAGAGEAASVTPTAGT